MVKKNLISPSQVYGIVDKCWKGRKSLYLIHWKGHPEFHSTWEPSARLDLLKDLVQGFENKYKTASTRFNSAKSTLTTFTTPGSTLANSPIQKKKLDFENVTNSEKKLSPSALIVWKALDKTPPKPSIRGVRRQRKKLEFSAKKCKKACGLCLNRVKSAAQLTPLLQVACCV